jgi:hypothetical protein
MENEKDKHRINWDQKRKTIEQQSKESLSEEAT